MDLGDAVEVLNSSDRQDLQKEQKDIERHRETAKEFRDALRQKRGELKTRNKDGVPIPKMPIKKWPPVNPGPALFTQAYLQSVVPTGAHVWVANRSGAWHVHFKPKGCIVKFPRRSRQWSVEGELAAATYIVQQSWRAFLSLHQLEVSACPLKGLFPAGDDGQWEWE